MKEVLRFFLTGELPVAHETTIEIYAFMDAANLSAQTGQPVELADVIQKAKAEAQKKLKEYK